MKNFFMKWLISLMVVMCQVSCSDTEEVDMVSMCPDSVGTSKVSLVKEMLSATDSSFFASLLPLLERNRVIRLDSRDDLSGYRTRCQCLRIWISNGILICWGARNFILCET